MVPRIVLTAFFAVVISSLLIMSIIKPYQW